ncbi:hypothetical protein ZIOFF_008931 [Zingiber officinale]|uniref:Uncharacterized protein n=1 Tax=Zingiber officinale TaxID=94328 RepID=A0A8J5I405_ZINOF|nr:hypothetical protein ZIOFF_008931 [Zingiber officinale]
MTTSTRCTYWSMRASDFLSISIHNEPYHPTTFTTQRGTPVSMVETLGRVISLQRTALTLSIRIYDGSGQIPCIQTLEPAHGTYVAPDIARRQAEPVELRKLVRVLGKLDLGPDGALQLIDCYFMVEHRPNADTLHIYNCMLLHWKEDNKCV